ncbi:MAG: DUF4384 domain-containing protein [Myxococcales bacterium]
MNCPSDLALEMHLAGAAEPAVSGHVESCAGCRTRLGRMRDEGEEFRREVLPAMLGRIVPADLPAARRRESPERRRWLAWAPLPAALALAAAALVMVMRPQSADPGYVGLKGAPLGLSVFASTGGPATRVEDGGPVASGASLRFNVRTAVPCQLWLLSVDERGATSRLYPVEGEGGAAVSGDATLPGGAVLDGATGPERLFAVCAPSAVPFSAVESAVASSFEGDVRRLSALRGLPAGSAQTTVLLEKQP